MLKTEWITFVLKMGVTCAALWLVFYQIGLTRTEQTVWENPVRSAFFFSGLIQFLFGLCCIVRNGGLFKTYAFLGYIMQKDKMKKDIRRGILASDTKLPSFTDYILERYTTKWDGSVMFAGAGLMFFIYAVMFIYFS